MSVYGLVRVGATWIALAADRIVEAVEAPSAYSSVPAQPRAMRGYFLLRGEAIATLDTFGLLHPEEKRSDCARHVVVLREADALFGVEVDAIGNTESVDGDTIIELESGSSPKGGIFPRLLPGEGTSLIGIADVRRLYAATEGMAALARGPRMGVGQSAGRVFTADEGEARQAGQFAIVRCADHLLCVDALSVKAVVPMPPLQQPTPGSQTFLGVAQWAGSDLAVMDLPSVLGLDDSGATDGKYMLVFEHAETLAAFSVDELSELLVAGPGDFKPVPRAAFVRAHLFRGAIATEKEQTALVIDCEALARSEALIRLPRQTPAERGRLSVDVSHVPASTSFIVFCVADQHLAVRTDQISEILARPPVRVAGRCDEESIGLIDWRGSMIELVSMRSVPGCEGSACWKQALIVNVDGHALAFAIDAVITMSGPGEATEVSRITDHATGEGREILTMGQPQRRSYRLVDLSQTVATRFG
ncbi:chemotaxis protein CheW (plasmid) [Paraburkholderia sp. PREW-6R]|uniref:chemotaxis protein CheW n=1 Tax=Paraburkholderia sp. PREW-6R TaxID=3141544 RepID=UPI0031F5CF6B